MVVDASGRVQKVFTDNEWQPAAFGRGNEKGDGGKAVKILRLGNMNATNNNPPAASSAKALKNAAPQRSSLDERLFMGFVVLGVVVMLAVMMFTFPGKGRERTTA